MLGAAGWLGAGALRAPWDCARLAPRAALFAGTYTAYVAEALLELFTLPLLGRSWQVITQSLGPCRLRCCVALGLCRAGTCCWQLAWLTGGERSLVRDGSTSTRRACYACCGLSAGSWAPHFSAFVAPQRVRFTHFDSYFAGGEGTGDATEGSAIQAYFDDLCLAEPDVALQHTHLIGGRGGAAAAGTPARLLRAALVPLVIVCRLVLVALEVARARCGRPSAAARWAASPVNALSADMCCASPLSGARATTTERSLLANVRWLDASHVPTPRETAQLSKHRLVRVVGEVRVVCRSEGARAACVRQHGAARADLARVARWQRAGVARGGAAAAAADGRSGGGPSDESGEESDVEVPRRTGGEREARSARRGSFGGGGGSFGGPSLDDGYGTGCCGGTSFREEIYLHMSAAAAAGLPSKPRSRVGRGSSSLGAGGLAASGLGFQASAASSGGRGSPSSVALQQRVAAKDTVAATFVHGAAPDCVRRFGMGGAYVLSVLLGLSWAFRIWFEFESVRVHFVLIKTLRTLRLFPHPRPPPPTHPSFSHTRAPRISTPQIDARVEAAAAKRPAGDARRRRAWRREHDRERQSSAGAQIQPGRVAARTLERGATHRFNGEWAGGS
jgi:hypothetical protein